jgi:hypothetical protein
LSALWLGAGGRIGEVQQVWLRARSRRSAPARALPFAADRAPPVAADEATAWDDVVREVTAPR